MPKHNIMQEMLKIIIPSLISILGFIFLYINVNKQIIATKENILYELRQNKKEKLINLISELIYELDTGNKSNIASMKPASTNHTILETKCVLLLNSSINIENDLIKTLHKYKTTKGLKIYVWKKEIIINSKQVIDSW